MALGQGPQALLTTLYRSTDCLCRRGAAVKNLAQSASLPAGENNAPSKPGTKQGDCPVAEQLLGWLRSDTIVLADKAYDADWLRRRIEAFGGAPYRSVGCGAKHPGNGSPPLEALLQPGALPCTQPYRTVLQQDQTLPAARDAIRDARRQLPCHAQAGCRPPLVTAL